MVTNNLLAGSTGFWEVDLKELGDNEVPTLAVCRRTFPTYRIMLEN